MYQRLRRLDHLASHLYTKNHQTEGYDHVLGITGFASMASGARMGNLIPSYVNYVLHKPRARAYLEYDKLCSYLRKIGSDHKCTGDMYCTELVNWLIGDYIHFVNSMGVFGIEAKVTERSLTIPKDSFAVIDYPFMDRSKMIVFTFTEQNPYMVQPGNFMTEYVFANLEAMVGKGRIAFNLFP